MKGAHLAGSMLALLIGLGSPMAHAQVIIGGDTPSVEVNWAVLDQLGREPNLADLMLPPADRPNMAVPGATKSADDGIVYQRYRSGTGAQPATPKVKRQPKPMPAATPVAVTSEPVAAEPPVKAPPAAVVHDQKAPPAAAPQPAAPQSAAPSPTPAMPMPTAAAKAAPAPVAPPVQAAPPPPQLAAVPQPVAAPPPVVTPPAPANVTTTAPTAAAPSIIRKGDNLSIVFVSSDDSHLPNGAESALIDLAGRMNRDESLGLQLIAYAQGDSASTNKARRISLSRALEIRRVLMDQGVRSTRIEVRALGNKIEGDPANRVDAVMTTH